MTTGEVHRIRNYPSCPGRVDAMSTLQLCAELRFLRVERNRYGSHPQLEVNVEYVKSRIKEMEESK